MNRRSKIFLGTVLPAASVGTAVLLHSMNTARKRYPVTPAERRTMDSYNQNVRKLLEYHYDGKTNTPQARALERRVNQQYELLRHSSANRMNTLGTGLIMAGALSAGTALGSNAIFKHIVRK